MRLTLLVGMLAAIALSLASMGRADEPPARTESAADVWGEPTAKAARTVTAKTHTTTKAGPRATRKSRAASKVRASAKASVSRAAGKTAKASVSRAAGKTPTAVATKTPARTRAAATKTAPLRTATATPGLPFTGPPSLALLTLAGAFVVLLGMMIQIAGQPLPHRSR